MKNNWIISVLTVLFLAGCTPEAHIKNQSWGNALGTTYSIIYIADEELDYEQEIDSVFQVLNQSMSTYIPTSDISKINAGDSTIRVDDMFREVFEVSSEVYKASDGYFDPTIGVLVNAWGFGPGEQMQLDSLRVDSLLQYVGWDKVKLNAKAMPLIDWEPCSTRKVLIIISLRLAAKSWPREPIWCPENNGP